MHLICTATCGNRLTYRQSGHASMQLACTVRCTRTCTEYVRNARTECAKSEPFRPYCAAQACSGPVPLWPCQQASVTIPTLNPCNQKPAPTGVRGARRDHSPAHDMHPNHLICRTDSPSILACSGPVPSWPCQQASVTIPTLNPCNQKPAPTGVRGACTTRPPAVATALPMHPRQRGHCSVLSASRPAAPHNPVHPQLRRTPTAPLHPRTRFWTKRHTALPRSCYTVCLFT